MAMMVFYDCQKPSASGDGYAYNSSYPSQLAQASAGFGQDLIQSFATKGSDLDSVYIVVEATDPNAPWFVAPATATGHVDTLAVSAGPVQKTQITLDQLHQIISPPSPPRQVTNPDALAGPPTKAQFKALPAKRKAYQQYLGAEARYEQTLAAYNRNVQALVDFLNSDEAMTRDGINTTNRVSLSSARSPGSRST